MDLDRLTRISSALAAQGIDATALMPSSNLQYLTGLRAHPSKRLALMLLPTDGRAPCVVLPALEVPGARTSLEGIDVFAWTDADGPEDALGRAVAHVTRGRTTAKLGIEYPVMRVAELRALERAAAAGNRSVKTVDVTPVFASLRMVKTTDELAAMAEAARVVEAALQRTLTHIIPGITERQLARLCTDAILDLGAAATSFESFAGAGPNSANPHHMNSDRPFQAGDLIIIDCGAVYGGYASDITRTVALGEPGDQARRIYEVVKQANAAGRAAVKPGATCEQIDHAARSVIVQAGYGDAFPHRTGHGLGLEVNPCHEPPDIVAGNRMPVVEGMTFTIEPGIYIQNMGGVRIEDDMVVTADGGRSLTGFERELIVLPA